MQNNIKGVLMAAALEYLLISRLREEVNLAGPKYLVWQSLFPKGFAMVSSKASKSSNLGGKSPDKVLMDFADEWADDKSKSDLVSVIKELGTHARKFGHAGDKEAHDLFCALSMTHRQDDRLSRAKQQLVDSVMECCTRRTVTISYQQRGVTKSEEVPCVLASIIENGYLDPWSVDDLVASRSVEMRGLSFLFSSGFKDTFMEMLRQEFGWKDDAYYSRFSSEVEACQWMYMSGELEDKDELEVMRTLLASYILAGLVGPGSFTGDLGFKANTVGTVRGPVGLQLKREKVVKYQLQPVVFNGQGPWSYFTDAAAPIAFTSKDVVRFGRSDSSDPRWLEECKGVVLTDRNVSRKQAVLEHRGTEWFLTDLGSANGTIVIRGYNGGKIFRIDGFTPAERRIQVGTGDIFFFGPTGGCYYDTVTRPQTTPGVEPFVRGKAFRFERIEQ